MTASRQLGAALGQLQAARERPIPLAITVALVLIGIGIAVAGSAIGALVIAAGMWVSGGSIDGCPSWPPSPCCRR